MALVTFSQVVRTRLTFIILTSLPAGVCLAGTEHNYTYYSCSYVMP
jgi:hypothetical protein